MTDLLPVTLDFESSYSTKDKFSLSNMTYEQYIKDPRFFIHGVGIKIATEPAFYVYGEENIKEKLRHIFTPDNNILLIGHNVMFDATVLHWVYGFKPKAYACTERMSSGVWQQRSNSLAAVAISCFPRDKTKRKTKEIVDFDGILRPLTDDEQKIMGAYCINDTELAFDCFAVMWPWLPDIFFTVMDIAIRMFVEPAFELDRQMIKDYLKELETEEKRLIEASGIPRSVLSSNEQFAQWIRNQGIPLQKVHSPTPKNPNNTKWPLAKNSPEFVKLQADFPAFNSAWEARLAVKSTLDTSRCLRMLEHAEPVALKPAPKLALALQTSAAHTHRFGGTNKLNSLNLKRKSPQRRALRAPEGFVIGVSDSSQIEARELAWFAGETTVLEAFAQKRDLYSEFATRLFNEEVSKDKPEKRHVGKVCELGLGYRMGGEKLRNSLAVGALGGPKLRFSPGECATFVNIYRQTHPAIRHLWAMADGWLVAMAGKKDYVEEYKNIRIEHKRIRLPNGMYLNYPGLQGEIDNQQGRYVFTYQGKNHKTFIHGGVLIENIIQALAQATLWYFMDLIENYLRSIGGRIILQVHDEIVMLIPAHMAEEAIAFVHAIMCTTPPFFDNDLCLDAESDWDLCYSK